MIRKFSFYFTLMLVSAIFTNHLIMANPASISGQLEGIDYDAEGKASYANPGINEIEIWIYDPASPKEKYIKKKTVLTDAQGNFDIGSEFNDLSSIFLLSKNKSRSSAFLKLAPKFKKTAITDFVTEKIDSSRCVLVETYHRGNQYYCQTDGYYYLKSGIITQRDQFFFPELAETDVEIKETLALLTEIKAGPTAKNDEEIIQKLESVFDFLRNKTKNSMGTADSTIRRASEELFSQSRATSTSPLKRWPTLREYAAIYAKYGFIPTGNCTAWSQLTATLLYSAGIPADKMFVAKFNYDMSWIVEHWVIGMNLQGRWYSIDPQQNKILRFVSLESLKNPYINHVVKNWDYHRPFEAYLLPGSHLTQVPYLGDPKDLQITKKVSSR